MTSQCTAQCTPNTSLGSKEIRLSVCDVLLSPAPVTFDDYSLDTFAPKHPPFDARVSHRPSAIRLKSSPPTHAADCRAPTLVRCPLTAPTKRVNVASSGGSPPATYRQVADDPPRALGDLLKKPFHYYPEANAANGLLRVRVQMADQRRIEIPAFPGNRKFSGEQKGRQRVPGQRRQGDFADLCLILCR